MVLVNLTENGLHVAIYDECTRDLCIARASVPSTPRKLLCKI